MQYGGIVLAGLGKAVIGKKAGATVALDVTIPDEYPEAGVRGQKAKAEITVHDVKRQVVPELDQEYLESMGFDGVDEMRQLVRRELEAYLDVHIRRALRDQIDQYLLDRTELQIPEGISARQTERVVAHRVVDKLYAGVPEAEIAKEIDSLRLSAAEDAARELKLSFIMEKIAEDRDVTVTEDEVNGVINEIARRRQMRFDRVRDELAKQDRLGALYARLRNDKIRDALVEDATISDAPRKRAKAVKKKAARKKATKKAATKSTKPKAKRD
jgi:trigger factor